MPSPLQSFYIVRFGDCDPMGHLNNARYLDYMLNAREDHLREAYQVSISEFAKQGLTWVVTSHEIQYLRPAFYNEKVCIESSLIEATDSGLLVEMIMYDESRQQVKAVLWTTFTSINIKTGKREPHNAAFMQFLSRVSIAGVDKANGLKARINELFSEIKSRNEDDVVN